MKKLLFPTIALLLSSCAAIQQAQKKKMLDSWVGQPESSLIQDWGLPDNQMTNENDQKIYEYKKCRGIGMPMPGTFFTMTRSICDRYAFNISNGIISSNSYRRE